MPFTPFEQLPEGQQAALLTGLALAGQLFWGPDRDQAEDMLRGEFAADLTATAGLCPPPAGEAAREMIAYLGRFTRAEELLTELGSDHIALLVTAPGGVPAPPYHSHYATDDGRLMGPPAQLMAGLFQAAGLDQTQLEGEPPDHLAAELEYFFFLLDNVAAGALEAEAARDFGRRVVLDWLPRFADRLADRTDRPFYPAAARFTLALVERLAG